MSSELSFERQEELRRAKARHERLSAERRELAGAAKGIEISVEIIFDVANSWWRARLPIEVKTGLMYRDLQGCVKDRLNQLQRDLEADFERLAGGPPRP